MKKIRRSPMTQGKKRQPDNSRNTYSSLKTRGARELKKLLAHGCTIENESSHPRMRYDEEDTKKPQGTMIAASRRKAGKNSPMTQGYVTSIHYISSRELSLGVIWHDASLPKAQK